MAVEHGCLPLCERLRSFSAHKNSVVAKFFKDIASDGEITVDGYGGQTRDFIHVDDLCQAVVMALQSDVSGEVFQIATGVESSIMDVAMLVQEVVGKQVAMRHGPPRQGDIRTNYSVIGKVRKMLVGTPRSACELV